MWTGTPLALSVAATGDNLTYQWQRNGINISGATSSVYTVPFDVRFLAENSYRVIVSNAAGSVISHTSTIFWSLYDPLPATLLPPLYNCRTGEITFLTEGGDARSGPKYFSAIGITGLTTNPNQRIDAELRADPKPITIRAIVDGVFLSLTFDLDKACEVKADNKTPSFSYTVAQTIQQGQPATVEIPAFAFADPDGQPLYLTCTGLPAGLTLTGNTISGLTSQTGTFPVTMRVTDPGGLFAETTFALTVNPAPDNIPLRILPPVYNCQTGAITFLTTGGNNTAIEYFAVGITPWTSSPEQTIEAGLRADPKPVTLYARQLDGLQDSFVFNLPAACTGAARMAADVPAEAVQLIPLGNPSIQDDIEVEIRTAKAGPLRIQVITGHGRVMHEQSIEQPAGSERIRVPLGKAAGVYLLRAITPAGAKTVKVTRY